MTDVSAAMQAKSDQLNSVDIIGAEPVIRIRDVVVKETTDQPVEVYFDGDNGRPWKPSKGMIRILAGAWGRDSQNWIGKHAKLYFDPEVMYAGEKVGGIRIHSLSDIDAKGLNFTVTINRKKRQPYRVECLTVEQSQYPEDRFAKALPKMVEKMQSGEMTLQQIIAQCQKTGSLSEDQIKRLEESAPVEITHEDDSTEEVF